MITGEGDSRGPRIAFQGGSGGGQELPAPEASASDVVDAGTGHRNYLTSECFGSLRFELSFMYIPVLLPTR